MYRVFDLALQSEKAIKILDADHPSKALDSLKEAVIPYKCQHKNIVSINEANIFLIRGEPMVVIDMELANGGSLEAKMEKQYIPVTDGLRLLSELLYGLEYAHINSFLHRDIKPANVLIHNNILKLSDFGLSVPMGSKINQAWMWYNTHAAPEIFTVNGSTATSRSDIFAFGMTMYRVVNNISDWRSFTRNIPDFTILLKNGRLANTLPYSEIIPNKVQRIVKKACNQNPKERFQTAAELRNAIDKLRPKCRWQPVSCVEWTGKLYNGDGNLVACVGPTTKNRFNFRVLKNRRSISGCTSSFNSREEALSRMYSFISANTFE